MNRLIITVMALFSLSLVGCASKIPIEQVLQQNKEQLPKYINLDEYSLKYNDRKVIRDSSQANYNAMTGEMASRYLAKYPVDNVMHYPFHTPEKPFMNQSVGVEKIVHGYSEYEVFYDYGAERLKDQIAYVVKLKHLDKERFTKVLGFKVEYDEAYYFLKYSDFLLTDYYKQNRVPFEYFTYNALVVPNIGITMNSKKDYENADQWVRGEIGSEFHVIHDLKIKSKTKKGDGYKYHLVGHIFFKTSDSMMALY